MKNPKNPRKQENQKLTCKTNPPSRTVAFPRLISSGRHSAPMSLKSRSRASLADLLQAFSPSSVRCHPASDSVAICGE